MTDATAVAVRLRDAYQARQLVPTPSSEDAAFDLSAAYAVERELVRMRRERGHRTVGVKVGFANKAVWRALKLETLVWGPMYDDTVHDARESPASLSLDRMVSPKIEPEIVVKLKRPLEGTTDAAAALGAVEWLALGFEIIDCPFPDWKFLPVDFVAAFGLHAALVVGTPRPVNASTIPALVDDLARFTVSLFKNDQLVAEGSGKNSLRSPALCLGELASAMARRDGAERLEAGDLVSTGTLTESQFIIAGETWRAAVDGIDLPALTLRA